MLDSSCKNIESDGNAAVKIFDSGTSQFSSNVIVDGNTTTNDVSINGNLTVSGSVNLISFLAPKPWAGFLDSTDGVGVATILKHVGYNTTGISVSHPNNGTYTFNIPAHPSGANYLRMLSP